MEEIKNLFRKHFGFLPDIISTTEHAYISPPFRTISSLIKLSGLSNKKVLRIIITDTYAIHPENCVKQICLPHLLNKGLFLIDGNLSTKELIEKFEGDIKKVESILKCQQIFSPQEISNYYELVNLYRKVFKNTRSVNLVEIYDDILRAYLGNLGLDTLLEWLVITDLFGTNSAQVRSFLKEAFDVLCEVDPAGVSLLGEYLENKKRLKIKNIDNTFQLISWDQYLKELLYSLNPCSVPFEIILYIYNYCGGSHFGNDYGMVGDINKMRKNSNILQITKHNQDYDFSTEIENVKFSKASFIKDQWVLSHNMYKTINTLSELFIMMGVDGLKRRLKDKC